MMMNNEIWVVNGYISRVVMKEVQMLFFFNLWDFFYYFLISQLWSATFHHGPSQSAANLAEFFGKL